MNKYSEMIKLSNRNQPKSRNDCIENATWLHEFYCTETGVFPTFWSLIGNDKDKLIDVFLFFCETRALRDDAVRASPVVNHLWEQLSSRWTKKAVPSNKFIEDEVEYFSGTLTNAIATLERQGLVAPAFELFSSGALSLQEQNFPVEKAIPKSERKAEFEFPQPDGGAFFYWAEFGLLAASMGFHTDSWKRILPILLRCGRIFALCYGDSDNGLVSPKRTFSCYSIIGSDDFSQITLDESQAIVPLSTTDLDQLNEEATACARFAFPGEEWGCS